MRALSLTQPWATLVAIGAKRIETRSWRTSYAGRIAIHAATGFPGWARDTVRDDPRFSQALNQAGFFTWGDLPRGVIVATARLTGCHRAENVQFDLSKAKEAAEYAFGDYAPSRWAWFLQGVKFLSAPVPCRGALGLWTMPADVERTVREALR